MTDNEIIKALECCMDTCDCGDCPAIGVCQHDPNCPKSIALDLINRQKEEIQRLDDIVFRLQHHSATLCVFDEKQRNNIRTEAIKEFADRLKEDVSNHRLEMYMNGLKGTPRTREITYECVEEYIDNLVKEMVGDVG